MSQSHGSPAGRLVLAVAVLAFAATAIAAPQSGRIDERQFRAARDLERTGQVEQAREIYRQIVDTQPDSVRADDALLALARLAWPVDAPAALLEDTHPVSAALAARSSLEVLRAKYAAGDAAAEGLWRLALTYLVLDGRAWRPGEAAALLTTLPVLYPDAPEVPRALALAARLDADAGRDARAGELAFRLLAGWGRGPEAAEAWLVLGRIDYAAGRPDGALAAFAAARVAAQASDDAGAASRALALATLVDRVVHGPRRAGGPYAPAGAAIPLPGRATDLAADHGGRLHAALARDDRFVVLESRGAVAEQRAAAGAAAVGIDRWGRPWLAHEAGVTAPGGVDVPVPERAKIVSVAPVDPASVWVVDEREARVLRIGVGAGPVVSARVPEGAEPLRAVAARDGGAWILTRRPALLVRVGPDGLPSSTVRLEGAVRDPADLESDALGQLYVLDGRAPAVHVLTPGGATVQRIDLAAEGVGIERPAAIAVDDTGAVAVYDAREKRVRWFR